MSTVIENMFEIALRGKMRFSFNGMICVEDLWDLPVAKLDLIFKTLNSQLKQVKEESLLALKTKEDKELTKEDKELNIKIEIIKYIVRVKLEEERIRLKAKEVKAEEQKILEILSSKKDQNLQEKSIEELEARLTEIRGK